MSGVGVRPRPLPGGAHGSLTGAGCWRGRRWATRCRRSACLCLRGGPAGRLLRIGLNARLGRRDPAGEGPRTLFCLLLTALFETLFLSSSFRGTETGTGAKCPPDPAPALRKASWGLFPSRQKLGKLSLFLSQVSVLLFNFTLYFLFEIQLQELRVTPACSSMAAPGGEGSRGSGAASGLRGLTSFRGRRAEAWGPGRGPGKVALRAGPALAEGSLAPSPSCPRCKADPRVSWTVG